MFEAALLVFAAAGGFLMLTRRWKLDRFPLRSDLVRMQSSPLIRDGLYAVSKPGDSPRFSAFHDLNLVAGGMIFHDKRSGQPHTILFSQIQWISDVTLSLQHVAVLTLHLEVERRWHLLSLQLSETDMALLLRVLKQVIRPARVNAAKATSAPVALLSARLVEETLQGETTLGMEVELYLLPYLLVVLKDTIVQAKLDINSIRRVLAVERMTSRIDNLLYPNTPDGLVRLYSLHETASFALPQYRELAEEIGHLARCPVDFILQEDKTSKA